MRPWKAALATALASVSLSTGAWAVQTDTAPSLPVQSARGLVGDALYGALVGFIGETTGLNYLALLDRSPTVAFGTVGDVIDYNGLQLMLDGELHGLYDPQTRTIHLVQPWSLVNKWDHAVLLHEMVHDAQLASGNWACAEETEWEAHLVQDAYLASHGIESGFDFNKIAVKSACP